MSRSMNLASAFELSVSKQPQKIALFWGEQEYSYAALWSQTLFVADELRQRFGVKPGDRVGLWLKNCPEFIPSLFGILQAGAAAVPINSFFKPEEVGYVLSDAGIEVLITDAELAVHVPALAAGRRRVSAFRVDEIAEPTAAHDKAPNSKKSATQTGPLAAEVSSPANALALIIYTSGTTGRPKGAMLSHGNLLHNVESCRIVLETVKKDRFGVLLPMFHSYMMTVGVLLPLIVGGSIVLVKSLHPVRNVLQELNKRQASVLPAIPQFYRSLLHAPISTLEPLRLCVSGAAPLPVQVHKDFEAKFRLAIIEGYGLSEASPVVTKNPLDGRHRPGSIGLPIAHVEVSIQDETGRQLPANEIGEVCVRGGNVMLGYWNQPEETAKAIRNGWLLTGDVGYRDADGFYFITDRKKDMLLVNGLNVYPREIEEVLYQFPGVKEAAVIGRPDARRGEQPVAFVAPADGVVLEEQPIQRFVREKLADYKVPRKVVVLPSLPHNATGKILKTALRELQVKR
jgi:long-chain acyl-CoA synthetase